MFFWKRKPKEPGPPAHGPDFSEVDSREKALAWVADGRLERLFLMPPEFGGPDDPRNIVYVPGWVIEVKRRTDLNIIAPLVESGAVTSYSAVPEYRGRSFVPMSIKIEAKDPKHFVSEIAIWGEALDRGNDALSQLGEPAEPPVPPASRFCAGQVWKFTPPAGQPDARLTILRVEDGGKFGTIVHIALSGVSYGNGQSEIEHLPFAESAIERSVTTLERESGPVPDHAGGYGQWRQAFDTGKGGIFTIPVAEVFDAITSSMPGGRK